MNLIEYLNKDGVDRAKFAASVGTTPDYLYLVASGKRTPKAVLAIAIERESGGEVRCEELDPAADWPYIRATGRAARGEQLGLPMSGADS